MKRRTILTTALASMAGCAANPELSPTFVLVHGAWHGAWCWDRVRPLLEGADCPTVAVTLPGMGEKRAELSAKINLDSHIAEVERVVSSQPGPVVLVGHSYGGFVITGCADRLAGTEKLRTLIYLDAFVPQNGERVCDYMAPEARQRLQDAFASGDAAYRKVPARFFGVTDAADIAWVDARLTDHPAGTYLQALKLSPGVKSPAPRHAYISCTTPRLPVFEATKARVRADGNWIYRELATGHDAMVTDPQTLSRMLRETA